MRSSCLRLARRRIRPPRSWHMAGAAMSKTRGAVPLDGRFERQRMPGSGSTGSHAHDAVGEHTPNDDQVAENRLRFRDHRYASIRDHDDEEGTLQ